jgi:hypothetical protein
MGWGDETRAQAEAGAGLSLVAISSVPPPWLLNISSPFLSLFSYLFHPLSSFQTLLLPLLALLYPSTGTEPPNRAASIEIPDWGKFDQILYRHMASQIIPLLYLYKLTHSISLQRLLVALPVTEVTVLVTISDDLETAISSRLLTTYALLHSTEESKNTSLALCRPCPSKEALKRESSPTLGKVPAAEFHSGSFCPVRRHSDAHRPFQ